MRNLHLAHLHPNLDYGGKKRDKEREGQRHRDAEGSKRDLELGGVWKGGSSGLEKYVVYLG